MSNLAISPDANQCSKCLYYDDAPGGPCDSCDGPGSGFVSKAATDATNALLKAKDAEILALKEQVASLQRVLAHHRDADSGVNTAPGFEGVLIHKGNV